MSFFLGDYDATTLAIMTQALEEACNDHPINDKIEERTARTLMARRIMIAADAGERDLTRLRNLAQTYLVLPADARNFTSPRFCPNAGRRPKLLRTVGSYLGLTGFDIRQQVPTLVT